MQSREPEIFCPACGYRPRVEDRWTCMPSCGERFHTFWTGGVCPACAWKWERTQCPSCGALSPHRAWYHWPRTIDATRDRMAELEGRAS